MQYEFKCEKCLLEQVKNVKLGEVNVEPCDQCGAPPEKLKRILSKTPKHASWGRWSV